jgi:hypothetical protein
MIFTKIKKSTLLIATVLLSSYVASSAMAADKFILTYQSKNQWVSQNEAEPLRDLIKAAKSGKHTHFKVILPPSKRDLSVNRLIVLRDILERQLKHSFIIEEIKGVANANTLVMTPTHSK